MTKKKKQEQQKDKKQKEKIKNDAQENKVDFQDKYLRLLAETENMRKRMQKEKQDTIHFAIENTIGEFLPMIDNFENALGFAKKASEEVEKWAIGFSMILSQFRDILHSHGIIAFHSKGNQFDPHYHEAMETIETDEHPEGMIIEEFAKGYKSGKRILRPARVKVAKKINIPEEKASEETFSDGAKLQEEHN